MNTFVSHFSQRDGKVSLILIYASFKCHGKANVRYVLQFSSNFPRNSYPSHSDFDESNFTYVMENICWKSRHMYLQMWAECTYTYTLTSGSYEFDFAVQRCGNWDVIWLYFSIFPDTFLWLNIFLKFFFVSLSKVKYATTLCDCHVCHTYLWFNIKLFLWLICAQFLLLNILLLICCSVAMSGTGMGE